MKKSHSKDFAAPGGEQSEQPSRALSKVVAPGLISNDAQMGALLTVQYHRAVGGMTEVLKFGAMMMMLREHLTPRVESKHAGRGRYASDTGLKSWLKEHAISIKESTAYRFLHVAESVAEAFELPAKISFIELATKSAEELPENLQKKQLELWDFVNGTSQRSWLDRFKPPALLGGARDNRSKKTPQQKYEEEMEAARKIAKGTAASMKFLAEDELYKALTDAELDDVLDIAADLVAVLKKWKATPKRERVAQALEKLGVK